jgi:hypothetical protein
MKRKTKGPTANAVGRSRREYAQVGVKARTFVATFASTASPAEIAARLYQNQHPKPLEYFLELWRDQHIVIPTPVVVEVVRAYDRLLNNRTQRTTS